MWRDAQRIARCRDGCIWPKGEIFLSQDQDDDTEDSKNVVSFKIAFAPTDDTNILFPRGDSRENP